MEQTVSGKNEVPTTSESSQTRYESQKIDKIENSSRTDDELDITSEHFNPLKALYDPAYRVTDKQPKIIYQNMAAFETALKKVGISGLNKKPEEQQASCVKDGKQKSTVFVEEEKAQRRFQKHQMAVRTQLKVKSKHQRNLLMQMAQSEGPLKQLQQYVKDGCVIKVIIRKEHGIKGYVEGVIKMFDRHWNLLLVDVTECLEQRKYKYAEDKLVTSNGPQDCSHILQQLGIILPKQNVKNLGRKRVEITRSLPQLLLRGEHVVLIALKKT